MDSTPKKNKAQELANLLKRINKGADPRLLRNEATKLLPGISPKDIATAEQDLIEHGYSAQLVQQLSAAFVLMGILEEEPDTLRNKLPAGHIIRKVLAEHELLKCFIADLQEAVDAIQEMNDMADTSSEFRKLVHVIGHLNAMVEHVDREEDVIFPFLSQYNWASICRTAKSDHVYMGVAIDDLFRLTKDYKPENFEDFKRKIKSLADYLCPTVTEHIFQEDNILYPIALEVISSEQPWKRIKQICDEIGYCGIHS